MKKLMIALAVICAALVVVDFVYEKHPHFEFEKWPLFHALYGFLAFVVVVAIGAGLRFVISRREDYYGAEYAGDEAEASEPEDHLRG